MPLNEILATADERQSGDGGEAPEDDNAPEGVPEPTTMNTGRMLPPYLHTQTIDYNGGLLALATVMTLYGFVKKVD